MSDSYVTSKATLRCSCGDRTAKITVYPDRTVELTAKPTANISDHISMYNIAPFGKCHTTNYPPTGAATAANKGKLTPMPCVPGTDTNWINGKDDYIIKGNPALLKSSYCCCKWGGIITITDDGQVDTGPVDDSRERRESEEEINASIEEKFQLEPESVLDGIQLALDVAGMIPLVGAVPDLLNAAISAGRGDWLGAGLSLCAAVPFVGDAATAAKLARKGVKAAKAMNKGEAAVKATKTLAKEEKRAIAKKYISKEVDKKQLLKEPGVTTDNVDEVYRQVKIERKREAINFYKEHWKAEKHKTEIIDKVTDNDFRDALANRNKFVDRETLIKESKERRRGVVNHVNGIDFNHPIEKVTMKKGDIVYQYNNGTMGNYVTPDINAKPSQLGISPNANGTLKEKYEIIFNSVLNEGIPALKSTARDLTDTWSTKMYRVGDLDGKPTYPVPVKTTGGATQIYIPDNPNTWNVDMRPIGIIMK
ncbi:PAAR-like protein [Phocaeicola sp.]